MNLYGKIAKSNSVQRVVGKNKYTVRIGDVDPRDLYIMPVDSVSTTGNPRFFTVHKAMLSADPGHGPMTAQEQIEFFSKDELSPILNTGDMSVASLHRKTRARFDALKVGLRMSGESQDEIHVMHDGAIIEGNTRKAVLTVLQEEDPTLFRTVRVVCYPEGVCPKDIMGLLILRHVAPPARWESGDQTSILAFLHESGESAQDISDRYGIPPKKVKMLLEAGRLLDEYQNHTGDYRPDKFSIWLKVVGNRKLYNMLFLKDNREAAKPDADGLGGYDPALLPRFYAWVRNDKINARSDISRMTSKEHALLRFPAMLQVIDTEGATAAYNQLLIKTHNDNKHPGIKPMREALAELNKTSGSMAEVLMNDPVYSESFGDLLRKLKEAGDRFRAPEAA